ncbi:MAG TPA: LacI family DNA-binding transcriptional regulator [Burkholderiales bacterium]|nr:LacI family DNA-binding transcriptional regulator [Burkholderiales bacterium]
MPKHAVTLTDVAQLAGVSRSAVSRAFTPGASVAESTRHRVLEAAAKLGYRPNAIARTLATRRSRTIAIVVSYLRNQFYPLFVEQSSQLLKKYGYHVLLFVSDGHETAKPEVDELVMEMMQHQVDGIILASVTLSSALAKSCQMAGVPVVMFNRVAPVPGVHTVASDNVAGGRLAARALIEGGFERIAYIAGLEDSSTNRDREQGFRDELRKHGRRVFARAVGHYNFEQAAQAARELFVGTDVPDALFVANDHMAFAVLDTLRNELGLRVPDDVAVIGFDNVPQAAWGGYRLTTVEQDLELMTEAAVSILINQLSNGDDTVRQVITPVRLITRETTPKPGTVRQRVRSSGARGHTRDKARP